MFEFLCFEYLVWGELKRLKVYYIIINNNCIGIGKLFSIYIVVVCLMFVCVMVM